MKALVVYYSRTGTTKKVAEIIKTKLRCDIEEIITETKRAGLFGYMKCGFEAVFKKIPQIKTAETDPSDYDIIIIIHIQMFGITNTGAKTTTRWANEFGIWWGRNI